jgi:hypothetical protein
MNAVPGLDQDTPSKMGIRLLKLWRLLVLTLRLLRLMGEELDQDLPMGLEAGQPFMQFDLRGLWLRAQALLERGLDRDVQKANQYRRFPLS